VKCLRLFASKVLVEPVSENKQHIPEKIKQTASRFFCVVLQKEKEILNLN